MVATISVLKGGASGAAKYFTSTRSYYDLESSGVWSGAASERLGLFGKVRPVDFGLLLAGFLWSGIMTVLGMQNEGSEEEGGPSNHRRGRIVESRMSDDCEEILKERRATRSRNADDTMRDPAGFGRPNRYEFTNPFEDDDE